MKVNPLPDSGATGLAVGGGFLLNQHLDMTVEHQIDSEETIAAFPPLRIGPADDCLHAALSELKARGLPPVIINMSFNCPGDRLVETLDHAMRSFRRMGFDYLVNGRGVFRHDCTTA